MEKRYNTKVTILPSQFLNEDGTYDIAAAIKYSGHIAGICYDREGYDHVRMEPLEKTMKRVERTINNGHHSVYDHQEIIFYFENIPKMLAMVLNNEKQYTTSEKSARYTPVVRTEGSTIITATQQDLYNKWNDIFLFKINKRYKNILKEDNITKLAQENARYLVTVFMPTKMVYTTSLRQINYLVAFMNDYIARSNPEDKFQSNLAAGMVELIEELKKLNVLDDRLMRNEKHRELSLFGTDLEKREVYYGDVYSTFYKGSFAQLAQAQRHRTLDYQMELREEKEFYIPPILQDNDEFVEMWLCDMDRVKDDYPQGELVNIHECGTYGNLILKAMERKCKHPQLEICNQTELTMIAMYNAFKARNFHLAEDLAQYLKGARCTFPNYECSQKCGFAEAVQMTRKI